MKGARTTVASALTLMLLHASASAQKPDEGQLSLEEIAVMLASSNPDEVRMAIEASATSGSADVVPMIQERIKAGLPASLLDGAVDSLMLLGDPRTAEVFVALASHRRPGIRERAIEALVALKAKNAEKTLVRALSDSNAQVRAAAAQGLGDLGAKSSLEALFRAFDRDVAGAARSIGVLAGDTEVARTLRYLGRVPLTSLTPIFDAMLARRDLGESARLSIVTHLAELGTAEARGYLEGVAQNLPPDTPSRIRRAIEDAVVRIAQ